MKYTAKLENAYSAYHTMLPLDLLNEDGVPSVKVWSEVIQYSLPEYARKVALLAKSSSLDDFVKMSGGDFDNLAAVIKTAVDASFVSIESSGKIVNHSSELLPVVIKDKSDYTLMPDASFNQFPCDTISSNARAQYIIDRYPFAESLHVGLIGDDDFISLRLMQSQTTKVSVVEKDQRIIDAINAEKSSDDQVKVYELDTRDTPQNLDIDTFVTDPPYTFDGALAFIVCGLRMMGEQAGKEFYVVLNPTMMGGRLHRLITVLAEHGVALVRTENGISNYQLPGNFNERQRANDFLESIGIAGESLTYSSNSTMYVFAMDKNVDVGRMQQFVNNDNMYEHYA